MAIKIEFDQSYNAIEPSFLLAKRNGSLIGYMPVSDIHVIGGLQMQEASFCVYKYDNGEKCAIWDSIKDFRLAYCPEWDTWFEIYVTLNEEDDTVKNVSAKSLGDAELSQIILYSIEINTENDIAREDYEPTVFFDESNPKRSLLHRMLEKAPHYKIAHVDASIAEIQRTFTFDSIALTDAFQEVGTEINCLICINSNTDEHGRIARSISAFDLSNEAYCKNCKKRGVFTNTCPECGSNEIITGFGKDTNIFVSVENLAEGIQYSTDTGSVKNCFKLEAGDDLMTAAIVSCNPNGSAYIWHISDEMREDMSDELRQKLYDYDEDYRIYQNEHAVVLDDALVSEYNGLIDKYVQFKDTLSHIPNEIIGYAKLMSTYFDIIDLSSYLRNELMPSIEMDNTSATAEALKLNSTSLSPVAVSNLDVCSKSTATSAVLAMAKTIIDPRYKIKISEDNYSENIWSGRFKIINYSDDGDFAETDIIYVSINDDYASYVKQRIEKSISNNDETVNGLSDLSKLGIDDFKMEIKKYCLASLRSFADAFQTCSDILIEQGVANAGEWENSEDDLYSELYLPYREKQKAIESEIKLRESEIAIIDGQYDANGDLVVDGIKTLVDAETYKIQIALNMQNYLGTDLWLEFIAYRREDTYRNSNYISDGLTNQELFSRALEFVRVAQDEIIKSATLQHSITATLKNLLVMREFTPIVEFFEPGNWIRIEIDESVYRLRMISYEIAYNDLDSLSVKFSDVIKGSGSINDAQSILNQAMSMATSYDAVTRQANQGKNTKETLDSWVADGLALTKMKIIDSAIDQNVTWDNHGILCRQYLPITDAYDDKQLKIINRGLYLTDDGWETSKAGIGDFSYYDPETGVMKDAYGVIADTLVGNLILSEEVGIYNESNNISLNNKGVLITTKPIVPGEQSAFTIRKLSTDENGVETYNDVLYATNSGDLYMEGTIYATSGEFSGELNAAKGTFEGELNAAKGSFSGELIAAKGTFEGVLNAGSIRVDNGSGSLITMGQQISDNNDVKKATKLVADADAWFDFSEVGFSVRKQGSIWSTLTDNHGFHIVRDDMPEYVASFENDRLKVQNVQVGGGIIKRTSTGGFVFQSNVSDGSLSVYRR